MHTGIVLDSFLGQGFFGMVHKGHDNLHPLLAIKVFELRTGEDVSVWLERRDSLLKEGQRLREAAHSNVVVVKYIVQAPTGDAIWLAMDFCSGGSLQSKYEAGPMLLSEIQKIVNEVSTGLHVIHARGMIHRDIKPANILVDGGGYKIGDFGLVTERSLLGYASGVGYTTHLAPEVFVNSLTSVATDIWAFGMTIYRLIHGKAFVDQYLSNIGESDICSGKFADYLPWLPHVPQDWIKAIKRSMHEDPKKRFDDALKMAQALSRTKPALDWQCAYSPLLTTWRVPKGTRELVVTHETLGNRKHRWSADSIGNSKIKIITKGSSHGEVSGTLAKTGLKAFFKSTV